MATEITFRRGSNDPTSGSGITLAEPVFNTNLHTFHIGLGYGITAEWVGAPISGLSADIAAGITYKIPTLAAVKNYISGLCFGNTAGGGAVSSVSGSGNGVLVSPTTGAVVVSNTGVHSFNGLTGAVTGVTVGGANTFTALNTFNAGISASGSTFSGNISAPNIVTSFNGATGAIQGVSSVNGQTGAVTIESFTGYDYEIHVSQIDGNDTTGNGDLLTPVASITKALTLVGSQRKTIIVHPGTYTESPSITVQYTTITGPGLIGGNIVISGTVSTNTGCTISGIKMTNLTVTTPSGAGNVNILNCEVSGIFTKSSNADYTVLRLCDLTSASITGAGLVAIFGGNPNFITVNNASANVIVKSAVTVAPVLTAGTLSIVDCVVGAAVTNAVTSAASSVITLANSQFLTSNLSGVAPVVLNGFYSILNCVYDKPNSTLVATSGTGGTTNSIDYFQYINADKFITQGGTSSQFVKGDGSLDSNAVTSFNGRTGAVQGVSAAVAGTGISVSGATGAVTITNIGVQSFNGLTGAVGGVCAAQTNTFIPVQYFVSGLCSAAGITANMATISSTGLSTISGYGAYESITTVSSDTVKFAFDPSGDNSRQTLRPSDDLPGLVGNQIINRLPASSGILALTSQLMGTVNGSTAATTAVTSFNGRTGAVQGVSAAVAGTGISVSGATGSVTITNTGVQSFNGATGAVTGASLGANTFTGTQTLTAGLTTSYLYASTGSTFASTLQVNGGATFSGRTDFAGNNNFATGLTATGTLNTTSNIKFNGTTAKSITTTQAPLTIKGVTSGVALGSSNAIVFGVQATDPLKLYSTTGVVEINQDNLFNPYTTSIKLFTLDGSETNASVNISPLTYFSTDRTLSIQDASGTIALTSQLMGAVNGSTAATSAVTSFNGRTGAVQGVSAAVAGDGIAVSGATGAVTITNTGVTRAIAGTGISVSGATGSVTITNIGVQTFNGLTGAVTGVTVGGANTFTALNTFNAGISASALTVSGGVTFSGNVSLGDLPTGVTATSNDYVQILNAGASNYRSGIYRSYKTLAGSTSGIVCVTPSDTNNTVNTFEITLEYYQTGYSTIVSVHKFWVVVSYGSGGLISSVDYTESIVKGGFTTLVPFTITSPSPYTSLVITAAAPANTGKYSGWAFLTTVRVY